MKRYRRSCLTLALLGCADPAAPSAPPALHAPAVYDAGAQRATSEEAPPVSREPAAPGTSHAYRYDFHFEAPRVVISGGAASRGYPVILRKAVSARAGAVRACVERELRRVRVEERAFSVRARIRAVAGAPLQVSDVTTDGVGGESACACIRAVLASMRIDDPSPPGPLVELALSWPVQARYRGELELGPRYLGKGPIPE